MLLGIVEGDALFHVFRAGIKLSQVEQGAPQRIVGSQREGSGLGCSGPGRAAAPPTQGRLVLRPDQIKLPQSPQHWEELRGLPHLLAQFPGSR